METSVKFSVIFLMPLIILTNASPLPESGTNELTVIGTVGGKTYFLEQTYMDWPSAKRRCNSVGMELATVKSVAESQFLMSNYPITGMGFYWVGGRDALNQDQYIWDSDKSGVVTGLFDSAYLTTIRSCLCYRALTNRQSPLYSFDCEGSTRYVMCELVHN